MSALNVTLVDPPAAITETGLKLAVSPLGNPEALMVTLFARLLADTPMESPMLEPAITLRLAVAGTRSREGGGIFSCTDTDEVVFPEVPAITTVNVPVDTALFGVKVTMLVPAVLIDVALNKTFNPFGAPEADNFTFPVNPISLETLIVLVTPGPPTTRLAFVTEAASVSVG